MQTSQYHLFSLPEELLDSLTPRNLVNRLPVRLPTPEATTTTSKTGPRACAICQGIVFLDVDEQRAHFRSDWHRYNVKTKLNGGHTISEAAFSNLVDGLNDSLSGSASSDEDDEDDSDAVNNLLNKTERLNTRSSSPEAANINQPVTALTWFHSPPSTQLGIYRSILPLRSTPDAYLTELRKLQIPVPEGRTWALFMIAGGHFAGAIVRVSRTHDDDSGDEGKTRKKKQKRAKPEVEVVTHKTFHRYTTRRKQGGSQSANDNAKGAAKSAGAQLRRYGEQALRDDIHGLLEEWREDLEDCERIWIRANTSNRRIFYDYEGAPWAKDDERLRTFPFPTRRPTQSELTRCLFELLRPKISHYTEDELRAQDDLYLATLPKPKVIPTVIPEAPKEKPEVVKLSKEEEILREKWTRTLEMVNKNRLEPLKTFFEREKTALGGVDAQIPEWTGESRATILQLAVQGGHEEMVRWLLEEAGANPTVPVPGGKTGEVEDEDEGKKSDGDAAFLPRPTGTRRTAYDLAKTKPIRDIFRRCAALYPDRWDWLGAGRVTSALSQEKQEERDEKKKVRRKGLKDRVKEREAREKEKEKERPATPPVAEKPQVRDAVVSNLTPRRLGGGAGATDGVAGLTPEMRAKVERERRARAAEARMKALGAG